jgi:hypothetical protein
MCPIDEGRPNMELRFGVAEAVMPVVVNERVLEDGVGVWL